MDMLAHKFLIKRSWVGHVCLVETGEFFLLQFSKMDPFLLSMEEGLYPKWPLVAYPKSVLYRETHANTLTNSNTVVPPIYDPSDQRPPLVYDRFCYGRTKFVLQLSLVNDHLSNATSDH